MSRRFTLSKEQKKLPVRERLLVTAMALFADAGFEGTAVDEIVAIAGVNKRMVYHYFGSKEQLYHEVLSETYRNLEQVEIGALMEGHTTAALAGKIVETYFDFLRDHPEFTRLMLWENLSGGHALAQPGTKLSKNPILSALDKALRNGISAGQIRADIDARHLLISLIGLCQIYTSNQHTLSQALQIDLSANNVREEGIRHVTRLLLDGIKNPLSENVPGKPSPARRTRKKAQTKSK